jgi:hypothetical protein
MLYCVHRWPFQAHLENLQSVFLSSDENKRNFTTFLLDEWKIDKYATKLLGNKIMFVCEQKCIRLSSSDGTWPKEKLSTLSILM